MTIKNILKIKDRYNLVTELSGYIAKKCEYGDEIDNLNEEEKKFYFVSTLEEEVNSGGFGSFFCNSYGDYTKETVDALNYIGATQTAQLFLKAIEKFEDGIVPRDFEERQEIADELEDEEVWEELDEEFYENKNYAEELLEKQYCYIEENTDRII